MTKEKISQNNHYSAQNNHYNAKFQVLTTVAIGKSVLCDVTYCVLMEHRSSNSCCWRKNWKNVGSRRRQ
jgi:hypothetical protein